MKAPSFQWYPKDCDTDENVKAMSDQEFGFYMRCLNHSWLNSGLPGELSELARVMGRTLPYVKKAWARVGRCFEQREGRLVNHKQELQRMSVRQYVDSRRRGAEARWSKHVECISDAHAYAHASEAKTDSEKNLQENREKISESHSEPHLTRIGKSNKTVDRPDAYASEMQCSASASASASPNNTKPVVLFEPAGQTAFDEWWSLWSAVRGTNHWIQAEITYGQSVTTEMRLACLDCTRSYLESLENPAKGYNPENFILDQSRDGFRARWPKRGGKVIRDRQQIVMDEVTTRLLRDGVI